MALEAAGVRLPGRQCWVLKAAPDKWQSDVKRSADIDSRAAATKPWKKLLCSSKWQINKVKPGLKKIYCAKLMITGLNGKNGTVSQWLSQRRCGHVTFGAEGSGDYRYHHALLSATSGGTSCLICDTWKRVKIWERTKRWRTQKNKVHTFMDEN